jgi:hypothetical protein
MAEILNEREIPEAEVKRFRSVTTWRIFALAAVVLTLLTIGLLGIGAVLNIVFLVGLAVLYPLARFAAKRAKLPGPATPRTTGQTVASTIGHALVVVLLGVLILGGIVFVTCLVAFSNI